MLRPQGAPLKEGLQADSARLNPNGRGRYIYIYMSICIYIYVCVYIYIYTYISIYLCIYLLIWGLSKQRYPKLFLGGQF